MDHKIPSRPSCWSEFVYRGLMRLYPAGYRKEYERQMIQHFRDQWREASKPGGWIGITLFWAGVLNDLTRTVPREYCAMLRHPRCRAEMWSSVSRAFLGVFAVMAGMIAILVMPKTYTYSNGSRISPETASLQATKLSQTDHQRSFNRNSFRWERTFTLQNTLSPKTDNHTQGGSL